METLLIDNVEIVDRGRRYAGWVLTDGCFIAATGEASTPRPAGASRVIDGCGMLLLPGAIDEHVHFREPGLTEKADIASESRAAVAGGVTSFIDMPNTVPATVTVEALGHKRAIAAATSAANYGFFIGATPDNIDTLPGLDYTAIAGVKLFIGATTGNLVVDSPELLDRLFATVPALIAVHAEDNGVIDRARRELLAAHGGGDDLPVECHPLVRPVEACLKASREAIALARRHDARLHVMHVTTAEELELMTPGRDVAAKRITCETCPQYLLFDADDYRRLGARIKCNPAVKERRHREALLRAIADGRIDVIGTDHAPHLLAQKAGGALKAASGMPMIQWSLPLMLDLLGAEQAVRLTANNPATIYGIDRRGFIEPGHYADLVLVRRLESGLTISDADVVSRCGWTPCDGMSTGHRVELTLVNGRVAYSAIEGIAAEPPSTMPLKFKQ